MRERQLPVVPLRKAHSDRLWAHPTVAARSRRIRKGHIMPNMPRRPRRRGGKVGASPGMVQVDPDAQAPPSSYAPAEVIKAHHGRRSVRRILVGGGQDWSMIHSATWVAMKGRLLATTCGSALWWTMSRVILTWCSFA